MLFHCCCGGLNRNEDVLGWVRVSVESFRGRATWVASSQWVYVLCSFEQQVIEHGLMM